MGTVVNLIIGWDIKRICRGLRNVDACSQSCLPFCHLPAPSPVSPLTQDERLYGDVLYAPFYRYGTTKKGFGSEQ